MSEQGISIRVEEICGSEHPQLFREQSDYCYACMKRRNDSRHSPDGTHSLEQAAEGMFGVRFSDRAVNLRPKVLVTQDFGQPAIVREQVDGARQFWVNGWVFR